MRELEERMLTYHPDIKLTTNIENIVERKNYSSDLFGDVDLPKGSNGGLNEEKASEDILSPLVEELIRYSPVDTLNKFKELQGLRDNVLIPIVERIKSNIRDENGDIKDNPIGSEDIIDAFDDDIFDFDPGIGKIAEEIIEQIDFIEDQVIDYYDIDDPTNLDPTIENLKQEIEKYIEQEKKDFIIPDPNKYTQPQLDNINNLIQSPEYPDINNYEDYVTTLIENKISRGSDGVDYSRVADLNMMNYTLQQEISQMSHLGNRLNYIDSLVLDDILGGATQESLEFVVMNPNTISSTKTSTELEVLRLNRDMIVAIENMERFNNIDVRKAIYDMAKKFRGIYNKTRARAINLNAGEFASAAPFVSAINKTNASAEKQYENTLVDVISTSVTLSMQLQALANVVENKKTNSLLYGMVNLVEKEFDFDYTERELKNFSVRHNLANMK